MLKLAFSAAFTYFSLLLAAQVPAAAQLPTEICNPIGRIVQGTSDNFRQGQVVCSGEVISRPQSVQLLCFTSATLIQLTGSQVEVDETTCRASAVAANPPVRRCDLSGIRRLLCFIPKGPEEEFQVLEPDVVSSNPRPEIVWEAVPNSASYSVYLAGANVSWQRTVTGTATELAYPVEESALRADSAYEVLVTARSEAQEITAIASRVINITDASAQGISLQWVARTKGAQ